MIRIGVLSDTHIPRKSKSLPTELIEGIKEVDLIIHAGDINLDYVLYELEEIAPVEAVAGNTDDYYIYNMLGQKKIITVEECRIGIIHGDGVSGTTLERVKKAFSGEGVNCVVFGHSHTPFNEMIDGILYFNPGSPTDKRTQKKYSYGILEIQNNSVSGKIVHFPDKKGANST